MISPDANVRHTANRAAMDMKIPRAPSTRAASVAAAVCFLPGETCLPGLAGGRPGKGTTSFLLEGFVAFAHLRGKTQKGSELMPSEVINEWRKSDPLVLWHGGEKRPWGGQSLWGTSRHKIITPPKASKVLRQNEEGGWLDLHKNARRVPGELTVR